jgi:nucleotide-binding universal stress UspA family protein
MLAMDMSEPTEQLLAAFYSLCPAPETQIYLLHVVEDAEDASPESGYFKKTYSQLQSFENDLHKAGYDDVKIVWEQNEVLDGIATAVSEYDVDLLMLVSHGKGLLKSTLIGSTTFDVARATEVPTVIVKGEPREDYLSRVLVPTDFSKKSLLSLNVIRSLREHVGEVVFVHVIERWRSEEKLREKTEIAKAMLQELVDEMHFFDVQARYIIEEGPASKAVCHLAEVEKCSLIFTAKTGAGLVQGLLMGSTAQNITLNSECSLFIMPEEDFEEK